jgi:Na+/phosphate symporter
MSSEPFSILAGMGLFFYGLRTLMRGLESFASSRVRPTLQRTFDGPLISWLSGAALTLVSQSSNLSVIGLMSLTEIGFISLRSAYFAMLGASAGTTVWLWFVLSGWHLGPLLLAVGAFGLILAKTEFWEELMSALLAIGLALLGLELLFTGVNGLFEGVLSAKIGASSGSVQLKEQLSFVGLGTVLGLVLQSASSAVVVLLSVVSDADLTLATATALFLGANLGLTVTAVFLSRGTRADTRRLAWSYLITKGVGVLGTLFLFPTFLGLVERVVGLFGGGANLLTKVVVAQVLFNLINSLVFGVLSEPMMKILASAIPEKEIRSLGLAKRVRRMLFQDAKLASKELRRQLRLLELEAKANYDQVMYRLTTVTVKDSFKARAFRERNFRALKFTIHDLLFSVDRQQEGSHKEGAVILSLLEYYGALSRTLFHLEDHYEKGLSKKFRLPEELQAGLAQFKSLLDDLWLEILLESPPEANDPEPSAVSVSSLEEIVLRLNKRFGVEYQGYSTWLMETAGFLRLISSDLGQLLQRRLQLRTLTEE